MTQFVHNPETIAGQIDDDLVMMDIAKGSYFALNSVATRIWHLLESPLTADVLCSLLMQEYEVSAEECRADIEEHLSTMQQLGLIKTIS